MMKSIASVLNADVLYALRSMGHGDDLVLCDTNFPADPVACPPSQSCSGWTTLAQAAPARDPVGATARFL
ncbi:L-fucose mutarotase/ribose pyranase (RbsD/FucU family) [Bradyrhizobium sp. GM24.11]|jgi:L-fucose mutarotase/ribose pyranase (RbsD/FucU family)